MQLERINYSKIWLENKKEQTVDISYLLAKLWFSWHQQDSALTL